MNDEELIINNKEYKCYAFDVGAESISAQIKSHHAITLIALIITIIIMLILAGITLNLTLGEHGIFKTAQNAGQEYNEAEAREKLETVLLVLQAQKVTDPSYNQNEYINKEIIKNGMQIEENIVTVDGYKFEIDRSVPKIGKSLGNFENMEEITTKKRAFVLDGDTYINTNLQESEFIGEKFTVAARVKINKVGQQSVNYMDILGNHTTGVGYLWQFDRQTTILNFGEIVTIDYTPYYNQWIDIVATYENPNYKVYINGVLVAEDEETFKPYNNFLIGTAYSLEDRRMKGMIASVKIWDEKLEEEEIKSLSLLTEKTKVKSDNIKLEVILDNIEDVNNIGTIIGNNRFETRDFELEYAIKFLANTAISTTWNENEIFTDSRKWTIAARIKINQTEQASIEYMNILGNHMNSLGYTWQFDKRTASLNLANIATFAIDYTPYYDQWVDIFVVADKGVIKAYVNGELIESADYGENYAVVPYNNFCIGTGWLGGDRAMRGNIASVKMWNIALTQEEVGSIDMLKTNNIKQENIVNNVILENNEAITEIGNTIGITAYTYTLRH